MSIPASSRRFSPGILDILLEKQPFIPWAER